MSKVKYFICPMSKNIVDSILEINSEYVGILPTRRQIDYNVGYVNNWNTESFINYVRVKNKNLIIERDHSGINQGTEPDDGIDSFIEDSKYFDIIHIDPWKVHTGIFNGCDETIKNIRLIRGYNKNIKFEIGTEEAIRRFSTYDLLIALKYLKNNLTNEEFDLIEFVVIQSGVSLDLLNKKNKGAFDEDRFKDMVDIVESFGKKSKEHNGDYLSNDEYKYRFDNGLDSINIGPEFAQIETEVYLNNISEKDINNFYNICLKSNKWKKWIDRDIKDVGFKELINICGHYNYNNYKLPNLDDEIKKVIKKKIKNLLDIL